MSMTISGDTGITFPNASTQSVAAVDLPAGLVMHFANSTAPTGWLECNGAAVSRTTYAALFTAIGTLYGVGNGTTTFNLPDLRGQFLRGWDNGAGVDPARAIGSSQLDQFQGHSHTVSGSNTAGGARLYAGQTNDFVSAATVSGPVNDGVSGAPRFGTETRPRNIAMLPCIKT